MRGVGGVGALQVAENPTAIVINYHVRQIRSVLGRRCQEPIAVVPECQVPKQCHGWPAHLWRAFFHIQCSQRFGKRRRRTLMGQRCTPRGGHQTVNPRGAAVAEHPGRILPVIAHRVQESHRPRGRGKQKSRRGCVLPHRSGHCQPTKSKTRQGRGDGRFGPIIRRQPSVQPLGRGHTRLGRGWHGGHHEGGGAHRVHRSARRARVDGDM